MRLVIHILELLLDELRILNTMFWSQEKISHLKSMNASYAITKKPDPFYGAPFLLLVSAENCPTAVYDGSCVIDNMLNAAWALGVGSCWIHRAKEELESDFGKNLLKSLGITGDYVGIGHVALGYFDGEPPVAKPRKDKYIYRV